VNLSAKQIEVIKTLHDLGNNFGIKIHNEEEFKIVLQGIEKLFPSLLWRSDTKPTDKEMVDYIRKYRQFPLRLNISFKLFDSVSGSVRKIYELSYSEVHFESLSLPVTSLLDLSKV
jgi:hypothetical protein